MFEEILRNLIQAGNNWLGKSKIGDMNWGTKPKFQLNMKKSYDEETDQEGNNKKKRELYFYDSVNGWSIENLIRNLRYISTEKADETEEIWLYINSSGGSLLAGFSAMDEIYNISQKIPIYTLIDNTAASAATLMSIAGTKRFMKKNGFILIHELSSGMVGKYSSMKDEIENMDLFMKKIKGAYKQFTKIPEEAIDEMLRHDFWWDSDTALEYGLIDEVVS